MSSGSTFVTLFSSIQKQSKPFLAKRKKILQNLILLPATYLLRNSSTVCMQKPDTNLLLNFKSVRRLFLTHHYHTPHLYLVLCAHLKPPHPKKTPRGWRMGNQDRSHDFLGNTVFTNFCSLPVAHMSDPFPSFFTLISCLLPSPTTYVIKRILPLT